MTPAQHLRKTLEETSEFASAVSQLEKGSLIDDIYYIVAGTQANEGSVISRSREGFLNGKPESLQDDTWYLLQTNYDWDKPVPKADDRRTPVILFAKISYQLANR